MSSALDKEAEIELEAPKLISLLPKFKAEITNVFAEEGMVNLKLPSASAVVPTWEPLTKTVAPAIAAPLSSVIFPVMVLLF